MSACRKVRVCGKLRIFFNKFSSIFVYVASQQVKAYWLVVMLLVVSSISVSALAKATEQQQHLLFLIFLHVLRFLTASHKGNKVAPLPLTKHIFWINNVFNFYVSLTGCVCTYVWVHVCSLTCSCVRKCLKIVILFECLICFCYMTLCVWSVILVRFCFLCVF